MKLSSIKVSNMFSFEHKQNIEDCEQINFKNDLNILIGPNGSGKSNFLEILSELFKKSLFREPPFDVEQAIVLKNEKKDKYIVKQNQPKPYTITRNRRFSDELLKIKLELELTENDLENLLFIQENGELFEKLLSDYYRVGSNFRNVEIDAIRSMPKKIVFVFEDPNDEKFLSANVTGNVNRFVFHYLQWYKYIQNCILIGNKTLGKTWSPLKNSFATLGSSRDFNKMTNVVKLHENDEDNQSPWFLIYQQYLQRSLKSISADEPIEFTYVKYKIASNYNRIRESLADGTLPNPENKSARDFLNDDTFFGKLNDVLKKYLDLELDIDKPSGTKLDYVIKFVKNKTEIPIEQLSSGQKGIIHLIFSIFGFDLKDGMMFIDEPEVHIHPQMQKKYLQIIQNVLESADLQFIIATHSPIFVNSKTVEGCHRFYLYNEFTKVLVPKLDSTQRDLVRILDYTRATRVLFTDKVVMVEGDSDEYFYRFYFDEFRKNNDVDDIEFIHIVGKAYHPNWKKFFDDWGIDNYFIRDHDDFSGGNSDIESKYAEGIFILKKGDLEDYIGHVKFNKLENAIDFTQNRFETWQNESDNLEKINELEEIFTQITS